MEWCENEVKERILEIENDPRVNLKCTYQAC
jgi:hypothetical protein